MRFIAIMVIADILTTIEIWAAEQLWGVLSMLPYEGWGYARES